MRRTMASNSAPTQVSSHVVRPKEMLETTSPNSILYVISDDSAHKKCCQALRDPINSKEREAKRARNLASKAAGSSPSEAKSVLADDSAEQKRAKKKTSIVVATVEIPDDS